MASIGALVVDLLAKTSTFETDMGRAAKTAKKRATEIDKEIARIGKAVAATGAAAAVGFGILVKSAIDAADEISKLSMSTGVSVESLSQLGYAADLSGVNLEGLAAGLGRLARNADDVGDGLKTPTLAFGKLGIEVKKTDGTLRATEDILLDVADKFSQLEDGASKAAIAQELFGSAGLKLIPFLNQGRAGIAEMRAEADAFGKTIRTDAALAAEQFNDNLSRLGGVVTGVANQTAQALVPAMAALTDAFVDTAREGDAVSSTATGIANSLKFIVDVGSHVVETFLDVGNAIAAVAAAADQVRRLEFDDAFRILADANQRGLEREKEYNAFREKLWAETGRKVVDAANKADKDLRGSLIFGSGDGPVQEVSITGAAKIEPTAMAKLYEELNRQTRTQEETAIASYNAQKEALVELYEAGKISVAQYNARLDEALDDFLPEIEVDDKRIKATATKAADTFGEQFKDGLFGALENGIDTALTDGAAKGWKGFEDAAVATINRLVAVALAKQIAEGLFNIGGEGGGGQWAWVGKIAGALGFGGARANGGPVTAGMTYRINEREPEFFRPNVSGKVIPLSKMPSGGGGVRLTQHISVAGRVDSRTASQLATEAARRQRVATARFR